jgi:hypothetical protein
MRQLNTCYKLHVKTVKKRLGGSAEFILSNAQNRLRKTRSSTDCNFAVSHLTENGRQLNLPTYLVLVDYVKFLDELKKELQWEILT